MLRDPHKKESIIIRTAVVRDEDSLLIIKSIPCEGRTTVPWERGQVLQWNAMPRLYGVLTQLSISWCQGPFWAGAALPWVKGSVLLKADQGLPLIEVVGAAVPWNNLVSSSKVLGSHRVSNQDNKKPWLYLSFQDLGLSRLTTWMQWGDKMVENWSRRKTEVKIWKSR